MSQESAVQRKASSSAEVEALRNELEITRQSFADFASAAAHDLSRPASQIRALVALLIESAPGAVDPELTENIQKAAERMTADVKRLAAYAEAVATPYTFEDADTADLMREVVVLYFDAEVRGGRLVLECGSLPKVRCDRTRLAQAFRELIDNALKFRNGETVHAGISAHAAERHWEFSIRDDGIGIAPSYAERVLLPFKRLFSERYPGSGMGLAICRRIFEMHGGRLWLVSDSTGPGSEFRFTLPR